MANALEELKNKIAVATFGMSPTDAWKKRICIDCKTAVRYEPGDATGEHGQIYSEAGLREYGVSALCETCYDNIMGNN
jgi:urease beta subunit